MLGSLDFSFYPFKIENNTNILGIECIASVHVYENIRTLDQLKYNFL